MTAVVPPNMMGQVVRARINAAFAAIFQPPASTLPVNNGDLVIQATSNTSLTFRYKGSDGIVRSGSVTLL